MSFCGKTSGSVAKCQLLSKLSCSTRTFAHDIFLSYSHVGGWRNQHLQPSKLKFWLCCHLTTDSFSLGRLLFKSNRQLQNFRHHGHQNGCNLEVWLTMQLEKLSETSRFTYDINRQVKCNFQVPQSLSHDSEAFWPFIYKLFGLVFFVLKSLLGIARQQSHEKFTTLSVKPRSHVRILMYQKVGF